MLLARRLNFVPKRAMATKPPSPPGSSATTTTGPQVDSKETAVSKTDHKDDTGDAPTFSGQTFVNMNKDGVGFKADKYTRDVYLNPLLTPPPRSPRTPEDFQHPQRLGHWRPYGFDYTSPIRDRYLFHETLFWCFTGGVLVAWLYLYGPDFKLRDWSRREAYLRTTKREALGLPLIDRDVVDPDRIVLPTEEELGDFFVSQ